MRADKVLREILAREGLTPIQASRRIGRNQNYIASLLYKKTVPKISTYAGILYELGYDLVAKSREDGFEFHIDPPE